MRGLWWASVIVAVATLTARADWNNFPGSGGGNVSGPAGTTDTAVARWSGTTGKKIVNSDATLDQNGLFTTQNVAITGTTASTVPYLDGSKKLVSSAVTPTELGYLSGITTTVQAQINNRWSINGNAGTSPAAGNYIGTSDANDLVLKRNSVEGFRLTSNGPEIDTGTLTVGGAYNNLFGTQRMQAIGTLALTNINSGGLLGGTPGGSYLWGVYGDTGGTAGLMAHGGGAASVQFMLRQTDGAFLGYGFDVNATTAAAGYDLIVQDKRAANSTHVAIQSGPTQSTTNLLEFQGANATAGGGTILSDFDASGNFAAPLGAAGTPSIYPIGGSTTGFWFPATTSIGWSISGTQMGLLDSNGMSIGSPTRSTARLQVKMGSGAYQNDGIQLQANTTTVNTYLYVDNSSDFYLGAVGAGDYMHCTTLQWCAFGGLARYSVFNAGGTDTHTDSPGVLGTSAVATLANLSNTVGNYAGIHFHDANGIGGASLMYFEAHAANPTTHYSLFTNAGAGLVEAFRALSDQTIRMPHYGAGGMVFDSSGNVISRTLTNGQIVIGSTGATPVAANLTAGAGIAITTGAGTISIAASGTAAANLLTKTTDYSLGSTDNIILANCAAACTMTLESAAVAGAGATHFIKKIGAGIVTVATTSSQTIDGDLTAVLSDPNVTIHVVSDGSNWYEL